MKTAYIGIDPGKQGFVTVLLNENETQFYPMPYVKKDGKSVFCEDCLYDIIQEIEYYTSDYKVKVAIEEVQGRGGWSATNNFNFGYIAGMQKMMMIMLKAEITMVRPQKWQSEMRKGYSLIKKASSTGKTQVNDSKAIAEMIATTEWPDVDFRKSQRARKNDDNKIDSFLIAQYLKRIDG